MDVVAFSQRDPRWAGEMLGSGDLTIGQAGCLLSSVAALLASWGYPTDPHRLNEFVRQSFGYVDDNLFVFSAVDGLGCRFVELVDCERVPAPVAKLGAALSAGYGVVACVDAVPGGTLQRHWVWVCGDPSTAAAASAQDDKQGSGWRIVDPWMTPGRELRDLSAYLAAGWDPARGIFAAAIYERLAGDRALAWRSDVEAHQRVVCVRDDPSTAAEASAQDA